MVASPWGGVGGVGRQGERVMRLKNPRPPEPPAPRWQVVIMATVWLGGGAALILAMVGNLIVQVVR